MRITKKIAHMRLGKVLITDNKSLNGIAIESLFKFLDASVARGRLKIKPRPVETNAIFKVSTIPIYAGEQRISQFLSQTGYDLAGFCTGIVEKNEIIDGSLIKKGDKIIGLPSSGLHSNGYSLINDMLWRHKITFNHSYIGKPMPELLTPTTIYARQIEMLLNEIPIVGMAHITGGGLEENISRVIPNGLKAQIDWSSWERPDVFNKIKIAGKKYSSAGFD